MAHSSFLKSCELYIRTNNGNKLRSAMDAKANHGQREAAVISLRSRTEAEVLSLCQSVLDHHNHWAEVIGHFILSLIERRAGELKASSAHLRSSVTALSHVFQESSAWVVGTVRVLVRDYVCVESCNAARVVTSMCEDGDAGEEGLEEAVRLVRVMVGECMKEEEGVPRQQSRAWAAMFLVNQGYKLFFLLGHLKGCSTLSLPPFIALDEFPRADQVTYHFYTGRLCLVQGDVAAAERHLSLAFADCPNAATSQRRSIFKYLAVSRLCLYSKQPSPDRIAAVPSISALQQMNLNYLVTLVQAFQSGNLAAFDRCLLQYMEPLVRGGFYLQLEKLRLAVLRNLMKHAYECNGCKPQMKLSVASAALKAAGQPDDNLTVQALMSNLIAKGHLKGFMSLQHDCVVLRKEDPFRQNE